MYLGAETRKVDYYDKSYEWTICLDYYVRKILLMWRNVWKTRIWSSTSSFLTLITHQGNSFSAVGYRPQLDTSNEFKEYKLNLFQNLIGVLRWIIVVGRIDISLSKYNNW